MEIFRKSYRSYLNKRANQLFPRSPQTFQNELCPVSESCPHAASSWMETVCQVVKAGAPTTVVGTLLTFSLGVTTVLSMTTLMIGSRTSLPNTNCFIKAIDVYLGICFSFVFGALLEYAVAHYSSLQQMAAKDRVRIWGLYVIHHLCHILGCRDQDLVADPQGFTLHQWFSSLFHGGNLTVMTPF